MRNYLQKNTAITTATKTTTTGTLSATRTAIAATAKAATGNKITIKIDEGKTQKCNNVNKWLQKNQRKLVNKSGERIFYKNND